MKKEQIYEAEPIAIYDTIHIPAGEFKGATLDFGANPSAESAERLYDLDEPKLVEKLALTRSSPLKSILEKLGIDYPRCWLALNVPKERLIRNWKYDKPGDVDIISGNIIENRCCFDFVAAVQVKVRKVKAPDELRYFPSGTGTRQSYYTALMGFDKTLLLHLIVREPKPVPAGYAASWNPIVNTDFTRPSKACIGVVKDRLKRDLFGYGWIGWGQAYGKRYEDCGGLRDEMVVEPPRRPKKDDLEVRRSKEALIHSL